MKDVKLGIGIPCSWTHVPSDFFFSYIQMNKPSGNQVIRASSGPVDTMRNLIARKALELECTHLLFLDADMVFPEDTIDRLLSHDVDIVGGLCFKKGPPFDPTLLVGENFKAQILRDYPPEGMIEVCATGTACLLLNLDILEKIPYPWFEFTRLPDGRPVGEDIGFCYKARDAGFKVYVDCSVKTEHVTLVRVGEGMHKFHRWTEESGVCQLKQNVLHEV